MAIRLWFYDPLTDWSDLRLISELFIHNFCTVGDKNLRALTAAGLQFLPHLQLQRTSIGTSFSDKYFCLNQHQFQVPLFICTMVYISRQSFFSLCIPLYLFNFFISNRIVPFCLQEVYRSIFFLHWLCWWSCFLQSKRLKLKKNNWSCES
jgi:hypothetical protein